MRLQPQRFDPTNTPGGREGAWWTPPKLATKVADWSKIRTGDFVVDAGAGEGSLSRAFDSAGANVTAVELASESVRKLHRLGRELTRFDVVHGDFLAWRPRVLVDLVVTNPPWEDDWCDRFILHGTEIARRVIAIVPLNMKCGRTRADKLWRYVKIRREADCAERPNFDPTRDGGQRDCMVIECVRRSKPRHPRVRESVSTELWEDRWD